MNEDLFVRVVGSGVTIAILLVAGTAGALLGDDPDAMFAWAMVCAVTLSTGAITAIYRLGDGLDSI
ncbi:hypothetical protein [Halorubrum distributum]|uniref:Uncharacterized protein n=1 Tax=Halorubrum distributum TaxID=29283 RepID=A0A6B1IUU1_9EURY|nr:hypothetical protein [Halorubrum terrestre]MYL67191.1 hypothetical protein [Halorubrum terrestre]